MYQDIIEYSTSLYKLFLSVCVFLHFILYFTNQDSSNYHGKRLYINKGLVTLNYRHIYKQVQLHKCHSCHFMNFYHLKLAGKKY